MAGWRDPALAPRPSTSAIGVAIDIGPALPHARPMRTAARRASLPRQGGAQRPGRRGCAARPLAIACGSPAGTMSPVTSVAQDERHAADVGAHDRNATCHGLQHRVRHVVDLARIEHDIGRAVERRPFRLDCACRRRCTFSWMSSSCAKRLQCRALGARTRDRQPDIGQRFPDQRESAQRGRDVVNGLQVACDNQSGAWRCARRPVQDEIVRDR